MRAMTVRPGQKGTADVEEARDSGPQDGALLVRGRAIGVCGTDREIADGAYGTPTAGTAPDDGEVRRPGHWTTGRVGGPGTW
jgi:threonine dehydrogenase-like Zn-dependent dehydrogenase